MPFVSYAQNFEDVILNRAFGGVADGFYVDVGAEHPERDSVTKAFYERGWRGINVEPDPAHFVALKADRPRDLTFQLALGAEAGQVTFYDIPETGLSTTVRAIADGHRRAGRRVDELTVVQRTLDDVLDEHAAPTIHFLKIDVEGAEAEVLRGASFKRHRPWIVVIEATAPNSRQRTHEVWEPGVLSAGYRFAYDDGLNRFYVAEERPELLVHFGEPPNVFDDFVLWNTVRFERAHAAAAERAKTVDQFEHLLAEARSDISGRLHHAIAAAGHVTGVLTRQVNQGYAELQGRHNDALEQLRQLQADVADLSRHKAELEAERDAATAHLEAVVAELRAVHLSTSWRLTAPVRTAGRLGRRIAGRLAAPNTDVLVRAAGWLERHPGSKRVARAVLAQFPALQRRLRAEIHDTAQADQQRAVDPVTMLTDDGRWWLESIQRRASRQAT